MAEPNWDDFRRWREQQQSNNSLPAPPAMSPSGAPAPAVQFSSSFGTTQQPTPPQPGSVAAVVSALQQGGYSTPTMQMLRAARLDQQAGARRSDAGGLTGFFENTVAPTAGSIFGRIDDFTGGLFSATLDVVDTPRSAIVSTAKEIGDLFQGEGFSFTDWGRQTLDNIGMGEVLDDWGLEDKNIWLRRGLGFAGDVLLDPVTYIPILGLAAKSTRAASASKIFIMAGKEAVPESRDFLKYAGDKVLKSGGIALSPEEVRRLQAIELMQRAAGMETPPIPMDRLVEVARTGRGDIRTLRALSKEAPGTLQAGIRIAVPFTGRLAQRAGGTSLGRRLNLAQGPTQTVPLLPLAAGQRAARWTPGGIYQRTTDRVRTSAVGKSTVRRLLGGDYPGLKRLIETADYNDTYMAYAALGGANLGRSTSMGWANNQMEAMVQTLRSIPEEKWGNILPAMQGDAAAIANLGTAAVSRLQQFADGWRESANAAVGATAERPFLRKLDSWAPHTWSDDMVRYVTEMTEERAAQLGFTQQRRQFLDEANSRFVEGRKSLDPGVRAATIKPGEEFMGVKILTTKEAGMTPRQQADRIFREKVSDVDKESFSGIFSDDPVQSIIANIQYTADQIAKEKTLNHLLEMGVAVDMNKTWDLAAEAEKAKLNRFEKLRQTFLYRADPNLQRLTEEAKADLDEARAVLDQAKAEGLSRTEQAKRLQALADNRVARYYKDYRDGLDSVDAMLDALEAGTASKIETINRLQARLAKTTGKVNKTITRTQRRRGQLRLQIADLLERSERAIAEGGEAAARRVRSASKQLEKLQRQYDEVTAELATMRGYAEGRFNDATGAQAVRVLDKLDNELIPRARAAVDDLRDGADRMVIGDNGERLTRAQALELAEKHLEGAEYTAQLMREEVSVYRTLLDDADDMDWSEWYRLQLDIGSETLDEVFDVTSQARAREILQDPTIVRRELIQQLGLLDEAPDIQIAAVLRAADATLQADDIAARIEAMKRYANAPEHVNGEIVNWRNPEAGWGYGAHIGAIPANDMRNFYGPALTSRVDPAPGRRTLRRTRVASSQTKLTGNRYRIRGNNPLVFNGDVRHVNLQAVEAAITEGLPMHKSWGDDWRNVIAPRVRNGESLRQVLIDVYKGSDPLQVVDDLLTTPGRVSATARRSISRSLRRFSVANGHDSLAWFDNGEWVIVPHDRRALSMMDELPETISEVFVRTEEKRAMRMADTAQAKERQIEQLGMDVDMLRGYEPDLELMDRRLDKLRRELEQQTSEAVKQRNPMKEQATREARDKLEDALRYRDAADQHLQRIEEMVARNVSEAEINVERKLHEVANLERAAAEAQATFAKWREAPTTQLNAKALEDQINQLRKNISEEAWQKNIDAGMRQVAAGSSMFLPEDIAEGLAHVSKMNYQDTLKHLDSFMRSWKGVATTSPGFHIRNYMGGVLNNLGWGINPARYGDWGRMEQLWLNAQKGGTNVLNRAFNQGAASSEDVYRLTREAAQQAKIPDNVIEAFLDVRRSGIADGGQFDALNINRTLGLSATGVKETVRKFNPFSSENVVTKASTRWGGRVEQRLRGSMAMDVILRGGDITEAMATVHKYHFNYDDLSTFERTVARRVIPFYTWSRKNLPLQIEMMLERPVAFQRYMALKRNLEIGSEEQAIFPNFVNKLLGINLGFMLGTQDVVYLNPQTPFSDMTQMVTPDGIINSSAPWFKLPFQAVTQQDSFTKQAYTDEYVEIPTSWRLLYPAFKAIGIADETDDGRKMMPLAWFDNIRDAAPVLSQLARFPRVGSPDRPEDRKWTAFASWMGGIGAVVNTPRAQGNELYRIARSWQSEADRLAEFKGRDSDEYKYANSQVTFYRQKARELYEIQEARDG